MPLTITNPYRLRLECLRNVSPGCAFFILDAAEPVGL